MILLGLGANLPSAIAGPPRATLESALATLAAEGISVLRRSPWYRSAALGGRDQPDYVNGVAVVATGLEPAALLALLHRIEARFGRVRRERNEPRVLDLDLLDYAGQVSASGQQPVLPHPRLRDRAFVLLPIRDVAPDWRHPVSGESVDALIAAIPIPQAIEKL